jgi:dihydrofolate synthase / folylpolyglutamate synthase
LGLIGKHQIANAAIVLAAIDLMRRDGWKISEESLRTGLALAAWPARLQFIPGNPSFLIDSAHNASGMKSLSVAVRKMFNNRKIHLVFGVLRDKEYERMLSCIIPLVDEVVLTLPDNDRALDPGELAGLALLKHKTCFVQPDIHSAVQTAVNRAGQDGLVLAAGSIYMVGEILKGIQKGLYKRI